MKVVIINKSDSTGGAAVVSRRLMEALRGEGVDARMLVAEKLTASPFISLIASNYRIKAAFIADRLRIAFANGFCRRTLFQLDAAFAGIDISRHPEVRDADAVIINWINQGVLSLKGIAKLSRMGKRVIWTMHDMWNMTGLCHHAGTCNRFLKREAEARNPGTGIETPDVLTPDIPCGNCPLLEKHSRRHDLSFRVARSKMHLYGNMGMDFVAVSNWLAGKASESALLSGRSVVVIPNAFPMPDEAIPEKDNPERELCIAMGAARLDDPIKNFPLLIEIFAQLKAGYPSLASRIKLLLFGGIKDETLLEKLRREASPAVIEYAGTLHSAEEIADVYRRSHIVLSTSHYETLPGTLIEGQAYCCWPIATSSGGQEDIITDGLTGSLVDASGDDKTKAGRFVDRIIEADRLMMKDKELGKRLRESVKEKFAASVIARHYLSLIETGRK